MKLKVAKWQEKSGSKLEAEGLIRRNSNKPEYGSLMLTANTVAVNKGYLNFKTKIGFITAKVEDLMKLIENKKLSEGSDFSALVAPHRIVTLEKVSSEMTDDDRGYTPKINPSTGEILTRGGETIFRKTEVVEQGSDVIDLLVSHDTVPVVDQANTEFIKTSKQNIVAEL
jgi:hypothetical protein